MARFKLSNGKYTQSSLETWEALSKTEIAQLKKDGNLPLYVEQHLKKVAAAKKDAAAKK